MLMFSSDEIFTHCDIAETVRLYENGRQKWNRAKDEKEFCKI